MSGLGVGGLGGGRGGGVRGFGVEGGRGDVFLIHLFGDKPRCNPHGPVGFGLGQTGLEWSSIPLSPGPCDSSLLLRYESNVVIETIVFASVQSRGANESSGCRRDSRPRLCFEFYLSLIKRDIHTTTCKPRQTDTHTQTHTHNHGRTPGHTH
jgi:hypothetical protein